LSNDDRKSTVFSSRWNAVSDVAFLTDDGRLFHARVEATGKARSPSVERLVDGTTSMALSAERRRRRVSTSNVQRKLQQGTPALFHEDSAAVGQNAQLQYDSLRIWQPMEFTKQWGYAF